MMRDVPGYYSFLVDAQRWAASFEYGNLCRSRPVPCGSVGGRLACLQLPARLRQRRPAGRHSADKQQKNAILNDAGGFPTLELIEVRVYKRHGEDN